MPELQRTPTGKFHPGYGCAIFVLMILTFGFIVTLVVKSPFEQSRQTALFTVQDSPPLPEIVVSDEAKSSLRAKLAAFSEHASKSESGELSLTVQECATLLQVGADFGIGEEKDSEPFSKLFRITRFDPVSRVIVADIRLPMRSVEWQGWGQIFSGALPWVVNRRMLAGSMGLKPSINKEGSLELRTESITVPGKEVTADFVDGMKEIWDWLDVAKKKDTRIAATLKRISNIHFTEDGSKLILESGKIVPPSTANSR